MRRIMDATTSNPVLDLQVVRHSSPKNVALRH